ncbi:MULTISPECIES: PD-(D/E)XK nuclease family protein [Pseudomonadaceae]|uniref:PD-(D/E)XK nuclease superfamily protein n=2 Tax=Ectopseudomonas oleovorans TaxID=301 RepID=A0A379JVH6_ECTOL|nr:MULTISPECIES: PD-(D/E)XK nuclease family protein [Pseudomonas aeruginosa group]EZO89510.1 hypothetical protein V555_05146 [Pseudomonas aeruginosa BWH054]OWK37163.1 hypothetical protein PSOLE_44200 [Pseudomonas oleovorans subsp. oleovorans]SEJ93628.1 PD-(D/E)XK nuclease superfamily protein [Pseudomonas oleovorans]SUD52354.1 Uncharacterised protein [Pseudomonas oleovorans]
MQDPQFAELADFAHQFEPFRAMGIHSKELVHSRILATFLDRAGSHKLGAEFLNRFVMALAAPHTRLFSGEAIEVDALYEAVKPNVHSQVYRELNCIDLVVVFPAHQLVIGIENKVDAGEQEEQLARYQETLRILFPGFTQALVFLSPNGRAPKTANAQDSVPVYCMDYGQIAEISRECRRAPGLSASAAIFLDQFVNHIELHMTGSTRTQALCWELFRKNEAAYKEIVRQHDRCIERKVLEAFAALESRLSKEPLLGVDPSQLQIECEHTKDDKAVIFCSLHIRLLHWPAGVWVKIYKHNWLGVFPFIRESDLSVLEEQSSLPLSVETAKHWPGIRYVSSRPGLDEARRVLTDGNDFTSDDLEITLGLAATYVQEINEALQHRVSL